MKRLVLVIAAFALLAPRSAVAKGPTEATITGPGLNDAITMLGTHEGGLAQDLGFFAQTFGQMPQIVLANAPTKRLGPRYTVVYRMPGPNGDAELRQELYPYASGGPVTYMKPGQPFWDGQQTRGGWYVASSMKATLVSLGLPETAPEPRRSSLGLVFLLAAIASVGLAGAQTAAVRSK